MITYPLVVGRHQTRVIEVGSGPRTMVLVHGLGARADRWRRNLEGLAEAGFRCVALDLPGHGFASKNDGFKFTVPNLASFVGAAMDALDIGHAVFVGTSLGGYVGATMASRAPERIEALVLAGTVGIVPMGGEIRAALGERFGNVSREGIERKLRTVLHDHRHLTPEWIEEEWRINNSIGAPEAFAAIARYIADGIDDDVIGEELAGLADRPPIAIIWGARDRSIPPETGHRSRDLLGPELYAEIPETGHCPYFEAPDAFNQLVLQFLEGQGIKGSA